MKRFLILFISLMALVDAKKQSTPDSLTYIAGVVEYHPYLDSSANFTTETNLNEYLRLVSDASKQDVDILVFPEATLNRDFENGKWTRESAVRVPSPDEEANPCSSDEGFAKILEQLSCAATQESMYIVVNVAEIANCSKAPNEHCVNGETMYNTNVVFDRNGTIISTYRKINLFGESGFSPSPDNTLGIFDTDFGVRFGHFICFDIMFQQPAVTIVEKENITNVVFSTMWFSELPSLTAVEIQSGWAATHNVNLLASGANNPHIGSTGSGIYSGKFEALTSIMTGKNATSLLVAEISKDPNEPSPNKTETNVDPETMDGLYLKTNEMKIYHSKIIDTTLKSQFINLTFANTTCTFDVQAKPKSNGVDDKFEGYVYRAVVFDGVRSFTYKNGGVVECLVVACQNKDLESCGHRINKYSSIKSRLEFQKIEIEARVPKPVFNTTTKALNHEYYPVTLTTSIMPIDYSIEENYDHPDNLVIKMKMNEPNMELLTFGIFGRIYSKDHLPVTNSTVGYKNNTIGLPLLIALLLPILHYCYMNRRV